MTELKAHRILREIREKQQELQVHQNKCKHKKVTKKYEASTGNYDGDSYWTIFNCLTCLKRWTEDGST